MNTYFLEVPTDRICVGEVRRPTNRTYNDAGSIHDDATAQELGFRGGTIAAGTHLDQFPPVLLEALGPDWFRTGSISLYFRYATTDGEPVVAAVARPPLGPDSAPDRSAAQTRATLSTPDGTLVAEGTASVGPTDPADTALRTRDLRHDAAGLRILGALEAGMAIEPVTARVPGARQRAAIERGLVTEPLACYRDASAESVDVEATNHRPIALPSLIVNLFADAAGDRLLPHIGAAVGMWGAIELRFLHGPLLVDTDYTLSGTVVALGDSPKTEILWYDMSADDATGVPIASARILSRFVKASSPLYASGT